MVEEFDGAHGGFGSGSGGGQGHNRVSNQTTDYDERMQELKKHIRDTQDVFRRNEMRRKRNEQEKVDKWLQYKANQKKQREDQSEERRMREQRKHEPRQQPQPCLRTQGSGQISSDHGPRTNSVVVVAPSSSCKEVDVDSRVSTARKSQVFPPIAECRESPRGGETSRRQRHSRKAAIAIPRVHKKKDDDAAASRAGIQREKSVMPGAQDEFQGLGKSSDGAGILKLGSVSYRMQRGALVKVEETKLDLGEEQSEEDVAKQKEAQEQPTVSNKHMARRYRLRMMHEITSQVLQCRRKMASTNCRMSFFSLHEPDPGPQSELIM